MGGGGGGVIDASCMLKDSPIIGIRGSLCLNLFALYTQFFYGHGSLTSVMILVHGRTTIVLSSVVFLLLFLKILQIMELRLNWDVSLISSPVGRRPVLSCILDVTRLFESVITTHALICESTKRLPST